MNPVENIQISKWNERFTRLGFLLLHVLVFLIPLHKKFIPPVLIAMAVALLLSTPLGVRLNLWKRHFKWLILFSGFYVVHLVGMIYSENQAFGWRDMEMKLSFLVLPLILLGTHWLTPEKILKLMKTFFWGLILALGICLFLAIQRYWQDGDIQNFYYASFSVFHHPTYFALYLNLGVGILIHLIFTNRNKVRVWHFLLLTLFIIAIFQLASRAGILSLVLLLVFTFIYLIFPRLKWLKSLLWLIGAVLIAGLAIYNSSYALTRFQTAGDALLKNKEELRESSSAIRIAIWKEALTPIQENWLLGVGTGDVKDELQACYINADLKRAQLKRLNAHNQFLQSQLALGLPGFLFLLASLLIPFWVSVRRGMLIYSIFLFIVGFNMLTESLLEPQAGIIYYALMNVLFVTALFFPKEGNALAVPPFKPKT